MPLWLARDPLVLASASKVRRALLEAAGVPVNVHAARLDERSLEVGAATQAPGEVALMLARAKTLAVTALHPGRLVLGADQVLTLEERRFAKPPDIAAAREQLRALSGRTHELHSAIAFAQDSAMLFAHIGVARLTVRILSEHFIDLYLGAVGHAATASVGAYHIEALGVQLFERIEGDYFTVLGLPLIAALDFLRRRGDLAS